MATTKIRTKTPMKNKNAMWRRMSQKTLTVEKEVLPSGIVNEVVREKRNGRMLKRALGGMNHQGFLLPIHIWLFRAAGIDTPVLDEQMKLRYNDSTVEDVETIEGTPNAVA